jgi:membrane protein implicated in regulation of membrane protease activity
VIVIETISTLVIIYLVYTFFESRAVEKALRQPPMTGIESFIGKTARVIAIADANENETHLRVVLEGASWNAIAKGQDCKLIKVADTVKITAVDNLKLIIAKE